MGGLGVAIIGCGLIGRKRALALGEARLIACSDLSIDRAHALAVVVPGAYVEADWHRAIQLPDVNVVIVATTNDALAEIAIEALHAGKNVLIEKPAARHVAELHRIIQAARESRGLVRVGFNHRYHPALRKAREI